MPDVPEGLDAVRHRDLRGRGGFPLVRRAVVAILTAILVLALLNVFGQRAETSSADGAGATLEVHAPRTLRGGDIFELQMTLTADAAAIDKPRIHLGEGWVDGITVNTLSPEAADQDGAPDGGIVLAYGTLPAGARLIVRAQMQMNPTTVGRRDARIALRDGDRELARVDETLTVLP